MQNNNNNEPIPDGLSAIVSDQDVQQHEEDDDISTDSSTDSKPVEFRYGDPALNDNADELYDAEIDDEDEAYVYKNMRSGFEETIQVQRTSSSENDRSDNKGGQLETMNVLKPRDSDAILSCPCCLNVVCMDCQKHETIRNQYRAMFVMNIGVHWEKRYVYDDVSQLLVEHASSPSTADAAGNIDIVLEEVEDEKKEYYYSVYCMNCNTEVAFLDMNDEVYHFSGCVASQG